ncbi:DNA-binding SARP family transcriptional activator [Saccharothrix tamanrassetensis]|uniref:DNA-binding SARP family transcriptional activator n=1 Tax=Saccharothrix tamanrassetensis TaxID=1051531 RepID=A0A841CSG5_9PSEU|nr:BTAD domain-containing putative transcriptional regulator [Saccharothrix tamanrassetensis]MBB5959803.1 DNA-binding SARP family transcriptional activator [Saccharothrix tamanrassetensis]
MDRMTVEFCLLDDVQALVAGETVDIGHTRQRAVLAALLVDANRVVPVDHLVDRVWGEQRLPVRPSSAVQTYISLLRRALAKAEGATIDRRSDGYRMSVDTASVDLHVFRHLIDRARDAEDDARAVDLFKQAFKLWRGQPFGALDTSWLASIRTALEEERYTAQLDLTDVLLRRGQHAELLTDLSDRVALRPLDERLAGQLMLALYRSGRQADALRHYERTRRRLAEELGADPSQPLRSLHQRILAAHPDLTAPTRRSTPSSAAPAPLPRQLPAPPGTFTGRAHELAELTAALDAGVARGGTVAISAIGGAGGVGKTWLALHWAHRNTDRFPDGQLFVNLRGFDPTAAPLPAAVALRGFLDAFQVDPHTIPADPEAQAALYRSLVAGKRMLVVLDNAHDTAQAVPLLPGSPLCTVLVTSRHQLPGLITGHDARPLTLDVLDPPDARELLVRHLGHDRVAAEPDAVDELLACCAGLPLALSILAARAAAHPDFPLAVLAEELRQDRDRLDALDAGELSANLRAVFSSSYRALDTAAELFGLLGSAPGPDIGLCAAASLVGRPLAATADLFRQLERAHLVQQHQPGRYRMHDLIRLYATEQAQRHPDADRDAAYRRLIDFYVHTAAGGDHLLEPHRARIELDRPEPGCAPQPLADPAAATQWFAAEHACLLAAQEWAADRDRHEQVWQLAWTLHTFQRRQGHLHNEITTWRTGLEAARRLGDPTIAIQAHRWLGDAFTRAQRHDEAHDHLRQALTLAEQSQDVRGQAHTHHAFAWAWELRGDHRNALVHATRALRLYQVLGDQVGEARAFNQAGWHHARLGDYADARAFCERALVLNRRQQDIDGEAATGDSLGYIAHQTGRHADALRHYLHTLTLFRRVGNTYQTADTLERLGQTHLALGRPAEARLAWSQASDLYRAHRRTADLDRVRQCLADLDG